MFFFEVIGGDSFIVETGNVYAVSHSVAISGAKSFSRSHHAVIRVYGEAGNVIGSTLTPAIAKSGERRQLINLAHAVNHAFSSMRHRLVSFRQKFGENRKISNWI